MEAFFLFILSFNAQTIRYTTDGRDVTCTPPSLSIFEGSAYLQPTDSGLGAAKNHYDTQIPTDAILSCKKQHSVYSILGASGKTAVHLDRSFWPISVNPSSVIGPRFRYRCVLYSLRITHAI